MKVRDKIIASVMGIVLAFVATFAIAMPAQAYTLTFAQDQAGTEVSANRSFNAYKIFSVATQADGTFQYTYASDNAKTAAVAAYQTTTGTTLTDTSANNVVNLISKLNSADMIKFAANLVSAAKAAGVTATAMTNTATGMDGYYAFEETTTDNSVVKAAPFVMQVTADNTTAVLKSRTPDIDKTITNTSTTSNKVDDVNIGDICAFQLKSTVPGTYGYDTYTYKITDTMSTGLTVTGAQLKAMVVVVDGKTITRGAGNYSVTVNGTNLVSIADTDSFTGATFVITFDNKFFIGTYGAAGTDGVLSYKQPYTAGADITVDFNTTLNSSAKVNTPEVNTTKLTYSNSTTTTTDSTEHKVYEYTWGIKFAKTFSDNAKLFSGVKFKMTGGKTGLRLSGSDGVYTVDPNGTIDPTVADSLVLDSNGNIKISGLDEGTYVFSETTCPDGYTPSPDQTVTISATVGTATDGTPTLTPAIADGYFTGAAVNTPATFHLPSTGDVMSFALPVIGVLLMAAAAFIFLGGKLKNSNKNN